MKAVRCPVCAGTGTYWEIENTSAVGYYRTCHGCDGKGWVEVHEQLLFSSEPVIPLESYPYWPCYMLNPPYTWPGAIPATWITTTNPIPDNT